MLKFVNTLTFYNLLENLVGDSFNSPAEVSKAIGEDD
jgi:hypothetical protein